MSDTLPASQTPDWIAVDWIAVDWGTTHLRAWAMRGDEPVARAASDAGMSSLDRDGFEPALLALVTRWLGTGRVTPVIACGMVGSRQGWVEAPYMAVPCGPLNADHMVRGTTLDPRIALWVVPGLKQDAPADVMRGEETQIAGLLAGDPRFSGLACLPGTHTKWVTVRGGEVQSFSTFMTGELYGLIAGHSVLRHGLGGQDAWDHAAFAEAVAEALHQPAGLAGDLFRLRAEGLLHGMGAAVARARLSGLLIGNELAALGERRVGPVRLIGASSLNRLYAAALAIAGCEAAEAGGDDLTLAGLTLARHTLMEAPRRRA
ncbi:2-keto-3-deoxy-galactonokinase [Microvirga tunisiensis]|uniref:2-keto-3-deoxy-galactonokinase n=1 Tax=Pannonibacter tanglangensis TaxID=2750084 RepID=A0A7X5F148_9HYPH|nr:2-dehydro-3-deoxygalactonokinase [Pannonibacter sp. XCT-53]NBN77584.1 2-keto-3-deoxy-galactonokinase [Pannonibacter sp. XCT-53]